ncbi:MAG TPA: HPr family phosphocarrier protein [Chlamydiales bacterium]|nr:HPr family phosphocarrier protein [Chlamydiales bacterium]
MKLIRTVKVKNDLGLHTRPATVIVKMLQSYKSSVHFTYKKDTINARSIMSILMLALRKNASIQITVEGDDAEETISALVNAFENQFWETK